MITIAVDAMGGDRAPEINIRGALMALRNTDLSLKLVGPATLLEQELAKVTFPKDRLEVINADEVISMEDHAASGIRRKTKSSINIGLKLVKDGTCQAFVSAGNSGAVMAGSLVILGRISDVERPAIIVKLPTAEGFSILLDAGANVDCKASHLVQFAEMGHVYAEVIEGIKRPRVALLSNGSEAHKGNEITREAHSVLSTRNTLNYRGYVEGFDLFQGTADVVICDGFVGNVVLKTAEGLADTCFQWFRREIKRDLVGMIGIVLLRRLFRNFKKKFDYEPYGAAPLVGIAGMVLICHGGSTEIAIQNGILTAKRGVEENFLSKIAKHLEQHRQDESTTPPVGKDGVK